jgi:hypothetical protein
MNRFTKPPEDLSRTLSQLRAFVADIPIAFAIEAREAMHNASTLVSRYYATRAGADGAEARRLCSEALVVANRAASRAVDAGALDEKPYYGPPLPVPSADVAATMRRELAAIVDVVDARPNATDAARVALESAELQIRRYERRRCSVLSAQAEIARADAMARASSRCA